MNHKPTTIHCHDHASISKTCRYFCCSRYPQMENVLAGNRLMASKPLEPKSRNTTCVTSATRNRDNVAAHAATFSRSSLVSIRQTDIFLSVALTRNFTFLTRNFSVSWNFCSLKKSSKKILSTSMDFPWYCNGHKDSSFSSSSSSSSSFIHTYSITIQQQ